MNVTNLGVGSGLPLEDLVRGLVTAEAVPNEIRIAQKKERLTLELSGIASFKSNMSSFRDVLKKLTAPDAFNKQVVSSSSEAISVETNGFASNGDFSIEVQQLAQGSRRQSTAFTSSTDTVGTGTLTFTAGGQNFNVDIDAADDLSAIRDKINAQAENFGLTANIINSDSGSYLVYNSTISGDANNLTVTSTGDAGLSAISTSTTQDPVDDIAKSAKILVDGNLVTGDSNEFKNVIEDVTITVNETNIGEPANLSISQDTENGKALIYEFVESYNALLTNLSGLGAPEFGRLAFDPNVRQVKNQLAKLAIDPITGGGAINKLSDIGIEVDRHGKLQISTFSKNSLPSGVERLNDALENNLEGVGSLFASDTGVAKLMDTFVSSFIDSDGILTKRTSRLNDGLASVKKEVTDLEERLRSFESTLRKQFTALDTVVAGYNATASWIIDALKLPSK